MKQEERRNKTKKMLLESVKTLIQVKGCHDTTMSDIMKQSGLSKGAIFHYIQSKDELFAWVLQERLEGMDAQFMQKVNSDNPNFEQPMEQIANSFGVLDDSNDLTNQVLMYLLSKTKQPLIAEVLKKYYEQSVSYSAKWIEIGQKHGVIAKELDAKKTADMFVLLSYGLRFRSAIPVTKDGFEIEDYTSFIYHHLQRK